ncbi:MAG: hypothetical protein AB7T86_09405 [Xanthobacteraceae bacterium]|jgi:hypothetical protein
MLPTPAVLLSLHDLKGKAAQKASPAVEFVRLSETTPAENRVAKRKNRAP